MGKDVLLRACKVGEHDSFQKIPQTSSCQCPLRSLVSSFSWLRSLSHQCRPSSSGRTKRSSQTESIKFHKISTTRCEVIHCCRRLARRHQLPHSPGLLRALGARGPACCAAWTCGCPSLGSAALHHPLHRHKTAAVNTELFWRTFWRNRACKSWALGIFAMSTGKRFTWKLWPSSAASIEHSFQRVTSSALISPIRHQQSIFHSLLRCCRVLLGARSGANGSLQRAAAFPGV